MESQMYSLDFGNLLEVEGNYKYLVVLKRRLVFF